MLALRGYKVLLTYILVLKLIQGTIIESSMPYYQSVKYTIINQNAHSSDPAPVFYTDDSFITRPGESIKKTPTTLINKLQANDDNNDVNAESNNSVPFKMLHPFANSDGKKFTTASDSDRGSFNDLKTYIRRHEGAFCRRTFDGRSGYCILANRCLHIIRDYRKHGIQIDICTYHKNIPVICCPLADKHFDEQRISAKKCQEYNDAVRGIKIGMPRIFSDKVCVSSVPMIVGGTITRTGDFPHMAALGWTMNKNEVKWGCGGTLISDQFVLTAAHCITSGGKPPDIVRLGAQNINESDEEWQDIRILIIILHPKYRSSSYYHDIALLKLRRRVNFTSFIRPACLWQLPDKKIPKTQKWVATGWGRTEFLGPKSEDLQKVELDVVNQKLCKDLYRKERRLQFGIIDSQFCAGYLPGGKDTCQGDSGGPLHVELPEFNCVKFVVGVTSFGKFCASPNAPGVYTNIYSYLDWIEKIVFRND